MAGGTGPNCSAGFADGCGTVFKIVPGGARTTLHNFENTDGEIVYGGLVQATSGTFYGITFGGGLDGYGTIFSEAVGLGPFVTTLPTSRKVGQRVAILGNNLTGATSVSFNGTVATFTVVSSSEITTTVPRRRDHRQGSGDNTHRHAFGQRALAGENVTFRLR